MVGVLLAVMVVSVALAAPGFNFPTLCFTFYQSVELNTDPPSNVLLQSLVSSWTAVFGSPSCQFSF